YLNMCHIHLDTYINILKQAHQHIIRICNHNDSYIIYSAERIKLCNTLKEAEKLTKTALYNELPIFYNKKYINKTVLRKPPKFIKFPFLICTNEKVNKFLNNTIGKDYIYFRFDLLKISPHYLKLDRYCLPSLDKGDKISLNTSPIPPSNCPIG